MPPPHRRILSLWFPRLAAERQLRQRRVDALPPPFAVVTDRGGAQVLASLNAAANRCGTPPRCARGW